MEESLSSEELEKTKEFLKIVNECRLEHETQDLSFKTAVKFMMARKFDVRRAVDLYENHEITRYREQLARFDPTTEPLKSELSTGKFTVLANRDASGASIVMFTASKHSPLQSCHKVTLQAMVYQLDIALDDMKAQRSGIVFIYNMSQSKYSNFDYELSQKILSLLKGAYPARLKKVLIVMAPLWFKAPFKILRLFVREKLRDRVFMVGVSQISHHVPLSSLPLELGGSMKHDHHKWLQFCARKSAEVTSDVGGLTDLASYKFPLTSGCLRNGTLAASAIHLSDSSGQRCSDDEDSSSASSAGPDLSSTPTGSVKNVQEPVKEPVKEPVNGAPVKTPVHVTNSCDGVVNRKHKPEKIIMPPPPLIGSNGTSINGSSAAPAKESENIVDFSVETTQRWRKLDEEYSNRGFVHSDSDPGMSVEEFIVYMKRKGRKGLVEEYNEIKNKIPEPSFETSRMRENLSKNRYTDVLCGDISRVKLPVIDDDSSTDYINANYVDGYMQKNAFISTQGPLPRTFNDFWRMIWAEVVVVIVMTTRTVERCRQKCGQYWPLDPESQDEYGVCRIVNKGVESFQDYVITSLEVTNTETGQMRRVTHFLFNSWPDYGVPHSALAMLDFRDKVREYQKKGLESISPSWTGHALGPPIVVHCSAGIGRTGTFITLDISIMRLEAVGRVDIQKTVEKIRGQRAYSIQMPDQYVFCYLALLEYALSRGLLQDVDLSGFDGESESDPEE